MVVRLIRGCAEKPLAAGSQSDIIRRMETPKITAYLKTYCGWSNGVRAVLKKYNLEFEEKDIIKNPAFRWEMEQKSGQDKQPTLEINGTMLPDVSGEELEAWMLQNNIVTPSEAPVNVPLNSPCTDAEHAAMQSGAPLNFKG
jgi:glutaredoxin